MSRILFLILGYTFMASGAVAPLCGNIPLTADLKARLLHPSVFDTAYYKASQKLTGTPAQVEEHWLRTGLPTGLRGGWEFVVREYLESNPALLSNETNACRRFVRSAEHFSKSGRFRGWSGFFNIDANEWKAALSDVSARTSPAWNTKDVNLDRFEQLSDAINPTSADRIKIVVRKPRVSSAPVETFTSVTDLAARMRALADGTPARLKLAFKVGGYNVDKRDGNCARPHGAYEGHLCLFNLQDVEIDFDGNQLTFLDESYPALYFRGSQRTLVKNLAIDWNYKTNFRARLVRGTVTYLNSEGQTVTETNAKVVKIDNADFSDVLHPEEFDAVANFDFDHLTFYFGAKSYSRVNFGPTGFGATYPQVVSAMGKNAFFSEAVQKNDGFRIGDDVIVLRNRVAPDDDDPATKPLARAQTVLFKDRTTNDITVENVLVKSSPQTAFALSAVGRGFHFKNVKIRRYPNSPSWLATRGGGIVVFGSEGDLIVEGTQTPLGCANPPCFDYAKNNYSELVHLGDDAINLIPLVFSPTIVTGNGTEMTVRFGQASTPPAAYVNVRGRLLQIKSGDRFAFINRRQHPVGFATAKSVTHGTLPDGEPFTDVVFERLSDLALVKHLSPPSPPALIAIDLNLLSSRYLVRQLRIGASAGRGIAAQAPNGVIERNVIDRTAINGIQAAYHHSAFSEGPALNVVVRQNTLIKTGNSGLDRTYEPGAIAIFAEGLNPETLRPNGAPDPMGGSTSYGYFPIVQEILVQGNTILDTQGPGISAVATNGVILLQNTVKDVNRLTVPAHARPAYIAPSGAFFFSRVRNFEMTGNRCSRAGNKCTGNFGITVDPENTYMATLQPALPVAP